MTDPANVEGIKTFFETLIGVWVGAKAIKAVANIASFATNILTIVKNWNHTGVQQALSGSGSAAATGAGATAGKAASAGVGIGVGTAAFAVTSAAAVFALGKYLTDKHYQEDWGEFNQHAAEQAADEGVPEIIKQLHDAAFGPEEYNPDADRMAFAKELFELYGDKFIELDPNNPFWGFADALGYLEDNQLTEEERRAMVENAEEFGITADNWESLFRNLYNLMSEKYNNGDMSGVPSDWWVGGGQENGLTSEDISGFRNIPSQMRAAVREGVGGIRVTLDGQKVGNLVAPYVSEYVARYIV
jgi:hypothetical protein